MDFGHEISTRHTFRASLKKLLLEIAKKGKKNAEIQAIQAIQAAKSMIITEKNSQINGVLMSVL